MKLNKNVRTGIAIAIGVLLLVLVLQNMHATPLTFITWSVRLPVFVVVLLSVVIGFLLGKLIRIKAR